jgi:predicted unusual protein kinase regulating ubiquinone biosynthesis (AarF/ABC1/UbiB family)
LLRFVQYRQELEGVLGHEIIHIREQPRQRSRIVDLRSALARLSVARLHEYEADLGQLVFAFEKEGLNPKGYLTFLERMQKTYETHNVRSDITHGSIEERAIIVELSFKLIDFASLSEELEEIPADIKKMVEELQGSNGKLSPAYSQREVLIRQFSPGRGEDFADFQQERLQAAQSVPSSHLGLAVRDFLEERREGRGFDLAEGDEEILAVLDQRIREEVFPLDYWPEDKERRLAQALYYELFCGNYLFLAEGKSPLDAVEFFRPRRQEDNANLTDLDNFSLLARILDSEMFVAQFRVALAWPQQNFALRASQHIMAQSFAGSRLNEAETTACLERVALFTASFGHFCRQHCNETIKWDAIIRKFLDGLYGRITAQAYEVVNQFVLDSEDRAWDEARYRYRRALSADSQAEDQAAQAVSSDPLAQQLASRSVALAMRERPPDRATYQRWYRELNRSAQDRSLESLILLFKEASNIPFEGVEEMGTRRYTNMLSMGMDPMVVAERSSLVLFRLFERFLAQHPRFVELTDWQRQCCRHFAFFFLVAPERQDLRIREGRLVAVGLLSDTADWASAGRRQNIPGQSIEEDLLSASPSAEEISQTYHYLQMYKDSYGYGAAEELFAALLSRYLTQFSSWDDFFSALEQLERLSLPASELIENRTSEFGQILHRLAENLPASPSPVQIRNLAQMLPWIKQPFLKSRLADYYYNCLSQTLGFGEKLDLFFSDQGLSAGTNNLDDFIEQEVQTHPEWESFNERLKQERRARIDRGSAQAGTAFSVDSLSLDQPAAQDLLEGLITSWQGDTSLKQAVFRHLDEISRDIIGTPPDEESPLSLEVSVADRIVRGLMMMPPVARYTLLVKLLTGKNGLVSVPEHRQEFMTRLLEKTLQPENPQLEDIFRDAISVLAGTEEYKPIFFALAAMLVERIGLPAPRSKLTPWRQVPAVKERMGYDGLTRVTLVDSESTGSGRIRERMQVKPWVYAAEWRRASEDALHNRLNALGVSQFTQARGEKLSELAFAVELAQNLGALFVRFLQLLPQFVDLPDDYQGRFSRVYDAMAGQTKFAAIKLLEREWNAAARSQDPARLGFWDEVVQVGARVGGGSLMTVYPITSSDGRREVIKVLNPNLLYNLRQSVRFVRQIVDELVTRYGDKYAVARLVVEEVEEWIERDVNFSGFLEKDKRFKASNDDFGREQGYNYRIYVPASRGPASRYFIREEYVEEGANITDWEELQARGHDLKEIVSLLARNYLHQLQNGLVHSDVHVGNFRVTPDRRVAIMDRNLFLELDRLPQLKELVDDLVKAVISPEAGVDASSLADKLLAFAQTPPLAQQEQIIRQEVETCVERLANNDFSYVGQMLVALRKNGLKLPLELTLLFKNINGLNQMARRAGFNSVVEAFFYEPGGGGPAPSSGSAPKPRTKQRRSSSVRSAKSVSIDKTGQSRQAKTDRGRRNSRGQRRKATTKHDTGAQSKAASTTGGIDFKRETLNIDVQGQGVTTPMINNVPFDIHNFPGFTFQIIRIERRPNKEPSAVLLSAEAN